MCPEDYNWTYENNQLILLNNCDKNTNLTSTLAGHISPENLKEHVALNLFFSFCF
jgi:hypothetical protein